MENSEKIPNKKLIYFLYTVPIILQTFNFAHSLSDIHKYNLYLHFISAIFLGCASCEETKKEPSFNDWCAYLFAYPLLIFPVCIFCFLGFAIVAFIIAKILGYA